MKKYLRMIFYCGFGFLFIAFYLMTAFLTKMELPSLGFQKAMPITTLKTSEKITKGYQSTSIQTTLLLRQAEEANNRRIQRVEEVCRKYNLGLYKSSDSKTIDHPPVPQYSVFFIDRVHRLSFCPIYKAGSSTWLYNLCLLAGMTENDIEESKKQLSVLARIHYPEMDPSLAEEAFLKTIKIITVRHPFERLLSAYRDKLENTNYGREHGTLHFYTSFGNKIVKKYRKGGNSTKTWELLKPGQYMWNSKHPKPAGVEPTFREFVLYLINTNLVHYADDHWIPYYLFCTPCLLRYDIIAKVETMNLDQLYAIHVLGLHKKIIPRWRHKNQIHTGFAGVTISNSVFTWLLRRVKKLERLTRLDDDIPDVSLFKTDKEKSNENITISNLSKIYFNQLSKREIIQLYNKYKVDFDLFGYDHLEYLKFAIDY